MINESFGRDNRIWAKDDEGRPFLRNHVNWSEIWGYRLRLYDFKTTWEKNGRTTTK